MQSIPPSQASLAPLCDIASAPPSLFIERKTIPCYFMQDVGFAIPISLSLSPSVHMVNVDARVTQGHEQLSLELDTKAALPSKQQNISSVKTESLLARERLLLVLTTGKTLTRARYVTRQQTEATSESRES